MRSALFFSLGLMISIVSPWLMPFSAWWLQAIGKGGFGCWLVVTLTAGLLLGRFASRPLLAGLLWGQLIPVLLCASELSYLTRRVTLGGGCGTALRHAWEELTALLLLLGVSVGQLRLFVQARIQKQAPECFGEILPLK